MVIGLLMFRAKELYPFGEKSVLCMDLWGQYFPMYMNNKQAESLSELFYSWNGALGFNNWSQSAYYCNSIFLILYKIIPVGSLVNALNIFCLLKISFSAVSCMIYLRYKTKKGSVFFEMAAAVSYSTCAYMLAFLSQFMWTDTMIYVPLIMLGIEKLVNEKKILLYTVVLGIALISNFYIGYAVCIFCVLYFVSQTAVKLTMSIKEKRLHIYNKKMVLGSIFRFSACSLIAGALSAFVIIPVYLTISQTLASENTFPKEFEWYNNIVYVLQNLAPERPLYEEYEGANIFTGIFIFIGLPLYFINKSIPLKERISDFIVTVILLISLNCNYLDYIWHGFHFPNQLPARWSFLLSFFLVIVSCKGLSAINKLAVSDTVKGCIAGLIFFYVAVDGIGKTEKAEISDTEINLILIMSIGLVLISIIYNYCKETLVDKKIKITKQSIAIALSAVVSCVIIFDSGRNFIEISQYEGNNGVQVSDEVSYSKSVERSYKYGGEWKCGDDDFYRVEANSGHTFNPSMIGNYHGMGYYSSTMNGNVFEFLRFMGNRVYADKVSTVYLMGSPVQNSIFGIKYFMDFNKNINMIIPDMKLVEETEEGNFYENPTALPVAYAVSENVVDFEITDQIKPLSNQNDFINAMYGEDITPYKPVPTDLTTENVELIPNEDWNSNFFSNNTDQPSIFHYSFKVEEEGKFFMDQNFRAGKIHITGYNIDRELNPGDNRMAYIGYFPKDSVINIDITIENIGLGCYGLNVYQFDEQAWETAYNKFSSQALDVTDFKNTRITGEINLQQAGTLFTSIPQDNGWNIYCDGKKVETYKIADTLLGADIPEGQHEIKIKYSVPGLAPGFVITLTGVALLILYVVFRKRMEKTAFLW